MIVSKHYLAPPILCTFHEYFLIFFGGGDVLNLGIFSSEILRWCLVCVNCNSISFHSFIFKLCIMIVHTLNAALNQSHILLKVSYVLCKRLAKEIPL